MKTVPTSGAVGTAVRILGTDLTSTTNVSFNGISATFKLVSSTEILTAVPAGATTGKLDAETPGGKLSSNVEFLVSP